MDYFGFYAKDLPDLIGNLIYGENMSAGTGNVKEETVKEPVLKHLVE